jgi:antitoxin YefM
MIMEVIDWPQIEDQWTELMDRVNQDHNPLLIVRGDSPPIVMMALKDYEALDGTNFSLRSPNTAQWLLENVVE